MADPENPDAETEEPPDVLNQKKIRLGSAADRADQAVDAISPSGGNPARAPAATISGGAWTSPDAADFVTDLEGYATSIKNAFDGAAEQLRQEFNAQPEMVPHDDPRGREIFYPPNL